jgi:hypothetical protein
MATGKLSDALEAKLGTLWGQWPTNILHRDDLDELPKSKLAYAKRRWLKDMREFARMAVLGDRGSVVNEARNAATLKEFWSEPDSNFGSCPGL